MRILAALFIDTIALRQVEGPSTRIDLGGVKFSEAAPGPFPVTIEPHLVVIVYCPPDQRSSAALEVALVRAEITFEEPGTIEAHCRLDMGDPLTVPFAVLPPAAAPA